MIFLIRWAQKRRISGKDLLESELLANSMAHLVFVIEFVRMAQSCVGFYGVIPFRLVGAVLAFERRLFAALVFHVKFQSAHSRIDARTIRTLQFPWKFGDHNFCNQTYLKDQIWEVLNNGSLKGI